MIYEIIMYEDSKNAKTIKKFQLEVGCSKMFTRTETITFIPFIFVYFVLCDFNEMIVMLGFNHIIFLQVLA